MANHMENDMETGVRLRSSCFLGDCIANNHNHFPLVIKPPALVTMNISLI